MKIRWNRLNIYLLVALAAAAVCGCQTSGENRPEKLLSTLRLHLEADRDGTKANEPVPVYRETPVMVNMEKTPFLTEADVTEAKVIDVVGGLPSTSGSTVPGPALLEQYTTANRGKKIAVFSQFGEKIKDSRWLAAPMISRRITDGVFTFTPDATREEAKNRPRPEHCGQEDSNMDRPVICAGLLLAVAARAQPFQLPTANHALFDKGARKGSSSHRRQAVDDRHLRLCAQRRLADARGP